MYALARTALSKGRTDNRLDRRACQGEGTQQRTE